MPLFDTLEVGDYVYDTWWRMEGFGVITKKYKKTIHIRWGSQKMNEMGHKIYDKEHVNLFLKNKDFKFRK